MRGFGRSDRPVLPEDHVYGYFMKWSKYSKPHTPATKFPELIGNSSIRTIHKSHVSHEGLTGV